MAFKQISQGKRAFRPDLAEHLPWRRHTEKGSSKTSASIRHWFSIFPAAAQTRAILYASGKPQRKWSDEIIHDLGSRQILASALARKEAD